MNIKFKISFFSHYNLVSVIFRWRHQASKDLDLHCLLSLLLAVKAKKSWKDAIITHVPTLISTASWNLYCSFCCTIIKTHLLPNNVFITYFVCLSLFLVSLYVPVCISKLPNVMARTTVSACHKRWPMEGWRAFVAVSTTLQSVKDDILLVMGMI